MKKTWCIALSLMMCVLLFAACSAPAADAAATDQPAAEAATEAPAEATQADAEEPAEAADTTAEDTGDVDSGGIAPGTYTIGYIQAGPDVYYTREVEGVRQVVETQNGQNLVVLNSEYNQEKELANGDDLIAQGVDAIILMSSNGDAGQKVAQKCNEANIPLFLSGWAIADGPGEATGGMELDMYEVGKIVGNYAAENYPNSKGYIVAGVAGQGVDDLYAKGFTEATEPAGIEILDMQYGNFDRNTAIKVAQDMLTADPNVDFMYVENEDMGMGVATVLKDMGLTDKVALISINGSPTGAELFANGQMEATTAWSPTLCGMTLGQLALDYVEGKTQDTDKPVPLKLVTKDNVGDMDPWDLQELLDKYDGNVPLL